MKIKIHNNPDSKVDVIHAKFPKTPLQVLNTSLTDRLPSFWNPITQPNTCLFSLQKFIVVSITLQILVLYNAYNVSAHALLRFLKLRA